MITKKQWERFCWDLHDTVASFADVTLHGKRVIMIDLSEYKIVTSSYGEPKSIYDFERSIGEYTTLRMLYKSVSFHGDMERLYKMYREIEVG